MIKRWIGCIAVVAATASSSTAESTELAISTDKLHYAVGEEVFMTFTNVVQETIFANAIPYWSIIQDESDLIVSPCVRLPTIYPIGEGDTETDTWTQIDCSTNEQVAEGMYCVQVQYWTDSNPEPRVSSVPFCIGEPCALPTDVPGVLKVSSWGALKAQYK